MINNACPTRHIDTKNNKIQKITNFPSHGPFGRKVFVYAQRPVERQPERDVLVNPMSSGLSESRQGCIPTTYVILCPEPKMFKIKSTSASASIKEWSTKRTSSAPRRNIKMSSAFNVCTGNKLGVSRVVGWYRCICKRCWRREKRVLIPKVFTVFLQRGMHKWRKNGKTGVEINCKNNLSKFETQFVSSAPHSCVQFILSNVLARSRLPTQTGMQWFNDNVRNSGEIDVVP